MGFPFFKKKSNDGVKNAEILKNDGNFSSDAQYNPDNSKRPRLCMLGGTFDPMHRAHLDMAFAVCGKFSVKKMMFIPSGDSYFKKGVSSAGDRYEICRRSVEEYKNNPEISEKLQDCEWSVSDIEIKREGKTYSYETIAELKRIYPEYEICFLVGEDTLRCMENWMNPQLVFAECVVIAAGRPDRKKQIFDAEGHEMHIDHGNGSDTSDTGSSVFSGQDGSSGQDESASRLETIEDVQARLMKHYPAEIHIMKFRDSVSSSEIRNRIANGEDVNGLLMPSALEYITEKKLYL